jgi:hypothetical protein
MIVFALFHALHGRTENSTRLEEGLIILGVSLFARSVYLLTRL